MLNAILSWALLGATLAITMASHAQDYPSKPIKVVVPYPPGGSVDRIARLVADKLREKWGQSVIVENRSGATGGIGSEYVYKSVPDGYTLLYAPPGPLVINKRLYPGLGYDSDSFVPISIVATLPYVLVVTAKPRLPAETIQQFIGSARANPGRINYASQGTGGSPHLSAELLKSMAGIDMVHIPYKGLGPALAGLFGGEVDMMFDTVATVLPHVRSGKLRALAVGSENRNRFMPNVPAMAEMLPGFLSSSWHGVVAPPKTPQAIAISLSTAIAEGLKQPDLAKRLLEMSVDSVGSTPAETDAFMKQESERWGNVIRITGTKGES